MTSLDRLAGTLLGTAIGDAGGLPFEGLRGRRVRRRFTRLDRFRLFGRTGYVSDDTEQAALLAQALVVGGEDDEAVVRAFRRSMIAWLARLPFGIGGATLRSCVRMALGLRAPGVRSAGNGAAMRAAVLGVHLADDEPRRRALGARVATLTHTDPRAVEAAVFVAEVAALAARTEGPPRELLERATDVVSQPDLRRSIEAGWTLARRRRDEAEVARVVGSSGFVVCSLGVCAYCFARHGDEPRRAIESAIRIGGDTDTHAAIVGAWVGVRHGARALPAELIEWLQPGPFGASHLRGLAMALVSGQPAPRWSWMLAMLQNVSLFPVVLAHGFARLIPH